MKCYDTNVHMKPKKLFFSFFIDNIEKFKIEFLLDFDLQQLCG